MMRCALLLFWSLLLFSVGGFRPAPAARAEDRPAAEERWPRQIKGVGLTLQKAEADALREALKELESALDGDPSAPGTWTPDMDFVRRYVLAGEGNRGEPEEFRMGGKDYTYKTWILPLRPFPRQTLEHLKRQETLAERTAERQALAARFFAGLAAAVGAALGTLHLGRRHSKVEHS
jgi:hypothetical protein